MGNTIKITKKEKEWAAQIARFAAPYIESGMDIDEAIGKAHVDYQNWLAEILEEKTEYAKNVRSYLLEKTYDTIRIQEGVVLNP